MLKANQLGVCKDDASFDNILQFPIIARPVVFLQLLFRLGAKAPDLLFGVFLDELIKKIPGQQV